jgi:hypothetical protein
MTSGPVRMTGRSSCRHTSSVVWPAACPARTAATRRRPGPGARRVDGRHRERCAGAGTTASLRSRSCPATTSSASWRAVGPGVNRSLTGRRVAALTKTGGWVAAVLLTAADLAEVPDRVIADEAETLIVNG